MTEFPLTDDEKSEIVLRLHELEIEHHEFEVRGRLMLNAASNGIAPVTEPVRLQVGSFTALIPPGSFKAKANKGSPPSFTFEGTVAGARLEVKLTPADDGSIEFKAEAKQVSLAPAPGLVPVALTIGDDGGTTAVRAGHED